MSPFTHFHIKKNQYSSSLLLKIGQNHDHKDPCLYPLLLPLISANHPRNRCGARNPAVSSTRGIKKKKMLFWSGTSRRPVKGPRKKHTKKAEKMKSNNWRRINEAKQKGRIRDSKQKQRENQSREREYCHDAASRESVSKQDKNVEENRKEEKKKKKKRKAYLPCIHMEKARNAASDAKCIGSPAKEKKNISPKPLVTQALVVLRSDYAMRECSPFNSRFMRPVCYNVGRCAAAFMCCRPLQPRRYSAGPMQNSAILSAGCRQRGQHAAPNCSCTQHCAWDR